MVKIYYNKNGDVCDRYPNNYPIDDENRYIEVSEEDEERTLGAPLGMKWHIDNGILVLVDDQEMKNSEEYKQMMKENQLVELEQYLADTDYIITKLNEAKLEDDAEFEALKAQYSEQLAKRKEVRSKINELQQEIALLK